MIRPQDNTTCCNHDFTSWEDDGGRVGSDQPHRDLNSLLAQEQTLIMNAEAAKTPALYEMHRNASLDARQQINDTPYPEHEPHVFSQDRVEKMRTFDENLEILIKSVENNERLLISQFTDGRVSAKALQSRSRFLRQDRARLPDMSAVGHLEKDS